MSIIKIKKALNNPDLILKIIGSKGLLNWVPDDKYISWFYKQRIGESLNLSNPRTFNEKLQWLKLYDRNPKYTPLVDKYEVRSYIEKTIGKEYLIPLLGVWDTIEEIEWDILPEKFVLKTTHDSGGVVICKDKDNFDIKSAIKKLKKSQLNNYYDVFREWPYKNVQPRIIAEQYMVDESGYELKDYKFFCFNGVPKLLQVDFNRYIEHKRNLYDLDWNLLEIEYNVPNDTKNKIKKPNDFDEMIDLATRLSKDIPFSRIDFYSINTNIFFGEITFYPESGFGKFSPNTYDDLLGSWIELPVSKT